MVNSRKRRGIHISCQHQCQPDSYNGSHCWAAGCSAACVQLNCSNCFAQHQYHFNEFLAYLHSCYLENLLPHMTLGCRKFILIKLHTITLQDVFFSIPFSKLLFYALLLVVDIFVKNLRSSHLQQTFPLFPVNVCP